MAKISMHIMVETEERPDRWACRSPEFGFTVYGKSREEARAEVPKALAALLGSFHGDLEGIERFLKKRKVRNYDVLGDGQGTARYSVAAASYRHALADGNCEHPATEVSVEEVVIAA